MASRLYMGWRMVAVAFFVDFVAVGFFFYSYGVFFKAIAAEFGDSRLGVALGLTVTNLVGAIAAPLVGRALDRYPLRRVIGVGATSMALGFLGSRLHGAPYGGERLSGSSIHLVRGLALRAGSSARFSRTHPMSGTQRSSFSSKASCWRANSGRWSRRHRACRRVLHLPAACNRYTKSAMWFWPAHAPMLRAKGGKTGRSGR